ncbi:hypothetical protein H310_07303 [Aphanomyces invadans]|uniref:Symplekin C-terminal domain-containing protein n=1 Tax=Aphanomyces invadans TaxID=157072 RepID=A0A024U4E1_9STRA|nr:hypothetical protein H310_07303 [Aphanomyces invadans]ETW00762.1 hypothetical protein H310_07303 [Aphanomyces invadans]|eukprot:XP_008870897.1 hypothetical protein H310_07303 [Aphanomyces invadans]
MSPVIELINRAHMALDAAEKLDLLQRVKEIVVERSPDLGRSTPEYKSLVDAIVPFSNERNVAVAKFALQFIEDLMEPAKNPSIKTPSILALTRHALFESCSSVLTINAGPSSIRKALKLLDKYIPGTIYHIWVQPLDAHDPQVWDHLVRAIHIIQQTLHQFQDAEAVLWTIRILENCALHFSHAFDSVYRDPARSNVQPDAVHLGIVPTTHAFIRHEMVDALGVSIVQSLVDRMQDNPMLAFGRREYVTLVHSLSLLAVLRPTFVGLVVPALIGVPNATDRLPPSVQDTVVHAVKANLLKLLHLPSTEAHRNAITSFLMSYDLSERAFKALTKSKDRRRKYVSAPSDASLKNVKRDAAKMSFESPLAKRAKTEAAASMTVDSVVNMSTESVIQLVLNNMANLPTVQPIGPNGAKLELLHTPSGLKDRMFEILSRLATPSSVLAIKEASSRKKVRDPRLRGREKVEVPPSLVRVFDEEGLESVTDMICANAKTLVEPIIAVTKDDVTREYNAIKVNIKPVAADWCKQMAHQTIQRLLGNEYGVLASGKESVRETLVCRLATSRWLVDDDRCKPHKLVVDFVAENIHKRHGVVVSLLYHEYATSLYESMEQTHDAAGEAARTPRVYLHLVSLVCHLLRTKLDPKVAADKKLFHYMLSHIPSLSPDVLKLLSVQFVDPTDKERVTMGVVALRNFITERSSGQEACLHVLLHYATHVEESIRNPTIRCLANQIYPLPNLQAIIETHAIQLMKSLCLPSDGVAVEPTADDANNAANPDTSNTIKTEPGMSVKLEPTDDMSAFHSYQHVILSSPRRQYYLDQIQSTDMEAQLKAYAQTLQTEHNFSTCPQTEDQVLQRMELFLGLCAKRPDLFARFVTTYSATSPEVQHVLLISVDKLIKLLRQKEGEAVVLAQLQAFPPKALDFVCHVVKVLASLSKDPSTLVDPLVQLYTDQKDMIRDAASILAPIASELPSERVMDVLPSFFDLPLPRLVEVMQELLKPIPLKVDATTFLLALHHIPDENEKQKRILRAIGICLEHPVAFPVDVMVSVTSTLVAETPVPKYTLRTMIQAVQMHHKLRKHTATCLETLRERRVWEMDEALWIGWVKCAVVVQPHSFKAISELPVAQGRQVFESDEGKELTDLFKAYCKNIPTLSQEWRAHLQLQDAAAVHDAAVLNATTPHELNRSFGPAEPHTAYDHDMDDLKNLQPMA